ncbi:MAG: hypothetical protein J1E43_09060 [Christensenellaceae bacterium]|nr:hypothetical protein [Christensenellaceae bacterium]
MKISMRGQGYKLLLTLILCAVVFAVGVFIGHGGHAQPPVVSTGVFQFQSLDGSRDIDLGFLREGQRLTCELRIGRGSVELWAENAAGERVPDTVTYQLAVPEAGDYRLRVSGEDAAFSVATWLEEP